ncbi:hypothetical protein BpHYR1_041799 [Brachionus plicatilis]|uniref:Uncharacterized protein n=1 Tax=Brachionus plicatilis TaxID=10195 RepID=A0A3M7R1G8_BRAPC|nr:hypothetical protein BpHYR1_041799 [Brachionus plicatilis]
MFTNSSNMEKRFCSESRCKPKPATIGPISRNENAMNTILSNQSQTVQFFSQRDFTDILSTTTADNNKIWNVPIH